MLATAYPKQRDRILRRPETRFECVIGRPLRLPARRVVLALASLRRTSPRVGRWSYRVRDPEYVRGVREELKSGGVRWAPVGRLDGVWYKDARGRVMPRPGPECRGATCEK
jgi:hypothetical protein